MIWGVRMRLTALWIALMLKLPGMNTVGQVLVLPLLVLVIVELLVRENLVTRFSFENKEVVFL